MGRTKPTVSKDYIVGLTDGEGCFYVNVSKTNAYKAGFRVQLHFHLKLQEIDQDLLWKICNSLQCGNVYFQKEKRKNHSQCYRFTVSSKKDIFSKIIPFFKENPLQTTSKKASFDIFCQIADLVENDVHLTVKGIDKIRSLKSKMNRRNVGFA